MRGCLVDVPAEILASAVCNGLGSGSRGLRDDDIIASISHEGL